MTITLPFFYLTHGARLLPRSFVPHFLSWCIRKFFLNGPTLWVALTTLALVQTFLTTPLLSHAIPAQRIILIRVAVNSLRGPQFSWGAIFLMALFLRHATVARRVIFLSATVSQLARILPFGSWQLPAARFRSLWRFLSPPTVITAASFLGTS
jgi:hypothetical protein